MQILIGEQRQNISSRHTHPRIHCTSLNSTRLIRTLYVIAVHFYFKAMKIWFQRLVLSQNLHGGNPWIRSCWQWWTHWAGHKKYSFCNWFAGRNWTLLSGKSHSIVLEKEVLDATQPKTIRYQSPVLGVSDQFQSTQEYCWYVPKMMHWANSRSTVIALEHWHWKMILQNVWNQVDPFLTLQPRIFERHLMVCRLTICTPLARRTASSVPNW